MRSSDVAGHKALQRAKQHSPSRTIQHRSRFPHRTRIHAPRPWACQHAGTGFFNEIIETSNGGDLKTQIQEVVADGYAVYHVLANLFDGSARTWVTALGLDEAATDVQDQILLSLVVLVVCTSFWVLRPLRKVDRNSIYRTEHPPQVARVDCIMQEVVNWCEQNRPGLHASIPPSRFQALMNASIQATLGMSGAQLCGEQGAFFRTEEGLKYRAALSDGVNAYKKGM